MTIGLPRMHKEAGERRDFLPHFVKRLSALGVHVVIEEGYGAGMGIAKEEYTVSDTVRLGTIEECFAGDLVVVLRYPDEQHLTLLKQGACLVSMVHLATRPKRREYLRHIGVDALSIDAVTDDTGRRLVENLRAVGWNGVEAGFDCLEESWAGLTDEKRGPVRALILGAGAVGRHAVTAASAYGNLERRRRLQALGVPGVLVSVADYDVTQVEGVLSSVLPQTDLLIDATRRSSQDQLVVSNDLLGLLPPHAAIVDLSVDPYDCHADPKQLKAIEGIPQGSLDRYILGPEDPAWDVVPPCVSTRNRRNVASCYSWPGVHPRECMETYGKQLFPLLRTLIEVGGPGNVRPNGRFFHRALARGLLSLWGEE